MASSRHPWLHPVSSATGCERRFALTVGISGLLAVIKSRRPLEVPLCGDAGASIGWWSDRTGEPVSPPRQAGAVRHPAPVVPDAYELGFHAVGVNRKKAFHLPFFDKNTEAFRRKLQVRVMRNASRRGSTA